LYIKIITHTPKFLQPQTKPQILFEILSAHPFSFWLHRYGIRYISPQSNVKKNASHSLQVRNANL